MTGSDFVSCRRASDDITKYALSLFSLIPVTLTATELTSRFNHSEPYDCMMFTTDL